MVIDTEGLGGLEAETRYDARVFALSTLLCSTMIYNSLGTVDERAVENLSFIANLTQNIKIDTSARAGEGGLDSVAGELHRFFPSFLWVLRDFSLDLVDEEGNPITPNEYLEYSLSPQIGAYDDGTVERNRIREMLKCFFTDRRCVTVVRPINDEIKLQRIDQVPLDGLRPEFLQNLCVLMDTLSDSLKPKSIHQTKLSGSMYADLVTEYAMAMNGTDGMPVISTAFEHITQKECDQARADAMKAYEEALNAIDMPAHASDMLSIHTRAFGECVATILSRSTGEYAAVAKARFEQDVASFINEWNERNRKLSHEQCNALLEGLYEELFPPLVMVVAGGGSGEREVEGQLEGATPVGGNEAMYTDIGQIERRWEDLTNRFREQAKGPSVDGSLSAFQSARWPELVQRVQSVTQHVAEAKVATLEQELTDLKKLGLMANALSESHETVLTQQTQELVKLKIDNERLRNEIKSSHKSFSEHEAQVKDARSERYVRALDHA